MYYVIDGIFVPRSMSPTFNSMRVKFGTTFNKIRNVIKEMSVTCENLKTFLQDCYPDLTPQLSRTSTNTLDGVLEIVKVKCTLIDINILKAIVDQFNVEEADVHIKAYEDAIEEFCRTVTARLSLQESLVVSNSSPLKCETAKFVLEWDPDITSLTDIKNLLSVAFERLNKRVKVIIVTEGNSIIVTCTFPLSLTTLLIAKAQETLESLKRRGLLQLTIGHCTIYDHRRDKVRDE